MLKKEIELYPWQKTAVQAWIDNHHQGTLNVFTGGGKSLLGLECFFQVQKEVPNVQLVIVLPTVSLMHQWKGTILNNTSVQSSDIGFLGDGKKSTLFSHKILLATIQMAYKVLPEQSKKLNNPLMLIVDECHRAGSEKFSKVLDIVAKYRLGLSATPTRNELNKDGSIMSYSEQIVGQKLGRIVYQFSLKEARAAEWLPSFTMKHNGISLSQLEQSRYQKYTTEIKDLIEALEALNVNIKIAQTLVKQGGIIGEYCAQYVEKLLTRKQLLFQAEERIRVTKRIVQETLENKPAAKIIIFHERKEECKTIFESLKETLPEDWRDKIAIEHSGITSKTERMDAINGFRDGSYQILVSVKTLVEGIDVPNADVGIIVASTASIRQRIQTLGRILRRKFDQTTKEAQMHILYVRDTVDESIYEKLDWTDLTGKENNEYASWEYGADECTVSIEPPREPILLEQDAFEQLERKDNLIVFPQKWKGEIPEVYYRVDSKGFIYRNDGEVVLNATEILGIVQSYSQCDYFSITPKKLCVLVKEETWNVIGQVSENLHTKQEVKDEPLSLEDKHWAFKEEYAGPKDEKYGKWKNIRKGIRCDQLNSKRFPKYLYFVNPESQDESFQKNYDTLRNNANQIDPNGLIFYINSCFHAYSFDTAGKCYFLADVTGGLDIDIPNLIWRKELD